MRYRRCGGYGWHMLGNLFRSILELCCAHRPLTRVVHYKGGVYDILAVGSHSETDDHMVVYRSLKDGRVWVRPLSMFDDVVPTSRGDQPRFRMAMIPHRATLSLRARQRTVQRRRILDALHLAEVDARADAA